MNENINLSNMSINDLINGINDKRICFVVPSYQRGYRWSKYQIERLLLDLYDFGVGNSLVGDYYCLQPIVVKELDEADLLNKLGKGYKVAPATSYYEIVDGQQRMTTVFILLKYLLRDSEPYSIEFERDKEKNGARHSLIESMNFDFDENSVNADYADAHYFVEAFKIIKNWFSEFKKLTGKNNLSSYMETIVCEKTQIIWYELNQEADCYSVFKNINHGKIPLTDAELVKAMLLNSKYYAVGNNVNEKIVKQEQDRYARLWDEIQKALSGDGMWSFITGGGSLDLPTNIDFLIRLIVDKEEHGELGNSDYKYFSYFESKLAGETDKKKYIESVFESLKNTFRTLQDWYDDFLLHNYIGFILTYWPKKTIASRIEIIIELIRDYESKNKTVFILEIKNRIASIFNKCNVNDVNYEDNQKNVEKLLMLFNIEELNIIHQKFNFNVGEAGGWSVEHIKAQHSEITQADKRKDYLEKEKDSLEKLTKSTGDADLIKKINSIISQIVKQLENTSIDENDFKTLAELIDQEIDGFKSDDMHKLGNLALLCKNDNSSLGNDPFYKKREKINEWLNVHDKNIPYSTRKAFLKMYSPQEYALDFTRWRKSDFDDMFNRQKELLKNFIEGC